MEQQLLNSIMASSSEEAWKIILKHSWELFAATIDTDCADVQIAERERKISELDTFLAGSAWDLWEDVCHSESRTVSNLRKFWQNKHSGKAILILDALSLRESYWILAQARERGYLIDQSYATLAEIPGDTSTFAKSLGFGQRSLLANNSGKSKNFQGAFTESVDLPFIDCEKLIQPESSIVFWHHWPDMLVHEYADDGNGAQKITKITENVLTSNEFWKFIDRLCNGRTLVITSDHGYANSGLFRDIDDREQSEYMKNRLKSGRFSSSDTIDQHRWIPPLTLQVNDISIALGRKKWKSQGGYPTLTHGGLSILEMVVPYIQISKG